MKERLFIGILLQFNLIIIYESLKNIKITCENLLLNNKMLEQFLWGKMKSVFSINVNIYSTNKMFYLVFQVTMTIFSGYLS